MAILLNRKERIYLPPLLVLTTWLLPLFLDVSGVALIEALNASSCIYNTLVACVEWMARTAKLHAKFFLG